MSARRDILFVGPDAWDSVERRPHHLVRRLAASRRVLWLNPGLVQEVPRYISEPVKILQSPTAWRRSERGRTRLLWAPPDAPNVRVLSVLAPLPFGGRYPLAHEANTLLVAAQVKAALRLFPLERPVFLADHPKAYALARVLGMSPVVYDSIDDFAAFRGWHAPGVIERYERELVRNSQLVVATAAQLVERVRAMGAEAHLLPNGVDLACFSPSVEPMPIERPAGARVFGFVGVLYDWVDTELIEALARARPRDLVVIVGPQKPSLRAVVQRLEAVPNVRFVGQVPYREVGRWVRAFDACLLPFRRDRLTEAVNPIKLYEYFALGRPVLATAIPEVARYGELVALADTPGELPAALARVDEELTDSALHERRARERRAIGERHSWDALAAEFERLIDAL